MATEQTEQTHVNLLIRAVRNKSYFLCKDHLHILANQNIEALISLRS